MYSGYLLVKFNAPKSFNQLNVKLLRNYASIWFPWKRMKLSPTQLKDVHLRFQWTNQELLFFFIWNRACRILPGDVQNIVYRFRISTEIAVEIARLFCSPFRRIVWYSWDLISFREILVERVNLDFWSCPSIDESAGLYVVWIVKAEWVMTDLTCYD